MIIRINKFFKSIYLRSLIKKKFNYIFKKKINSKNIILVEFNKWSVLNITIAYLANILSRDVDAKIYAYSENLFNDLLNKKSFFKRALFFIGEKFNLGSFGIYRAFGTERFIKLNNINPDLIIKSKKKLKSLLKKNITRKYILNLRLENIQVGHLFYDTYLKHYKCETIEPTDKNFIYFLEKSILNFYFWYDYISKNRVLGVICSQPVYNSSIPARIAADLNIKCLIANPHYLFSLSKKKKFYRRHSLDYKKYFNELNSYQKKIALNLTKKMLDKYFLGKISLPEKMTYLSHSTYKKFKASKRNKFNSDKIKVLICSHAFSDAPHSLGHHFYEDYYQWLISILNLSKKLDYEWYLKLHPENVYLFDNAHKIIKDLIQRKFANVNIIEPDCSHHRVMQKNIDFVLTCNGSVASEYPYFGIPSINASLANPHVDFRFSITPKNKIEYINLLSNLKKIRSNFKINRREIVIFFLMHNFYYSPTWFIFNWERVYKFCKKKNFIYREIFFDYWLKSFSFNSHRSIMQNLKNFIRSKDYLFNFKHEKISFEDHIKRFI